MAITLPLMTIWCTSTMPAAGEAALTSVTSSLLLSFMKAPVADWWATVPRTHASVTVTSADACAATSAQPAMHNTFSCLFMANPLSANGDSIIGGYGGWQDG